MKTINGQILKDMFISGSNNLYNHYPEIDALNVFPVPDGDTGMNMNLTITSGSKEIQNRSDNSVFEISKAFARGLLMGARGNSGVITSQIFKGFSLGFEGMETANAVAFAKAWEKGVEIAYKAVMRPVEGTILTVIRESAHGLSEQVRDNWTIVQCMKTLIKEANESLKRTPELLPVLKEVGVVDAGGAGLIKIFDGMLLALQGSNVERTNATAMENNPLIAAGALMDEEEFGYCTEFIMQLGPDSVKKPFNEKRFTNVLLSRGNSLVVVHDEDIVKVHVHTMTPGNVLNYAQQFGEFLKLKIENMTEQHHALETGSPVEPHVDLVEEPKQERSKYRIIAVSSGDGIEAFFNEIGVTEIVKGGQTMNPSAEDFISAIKAANADNIYILPNNSNILMAATQAAEMMLEEGDSNVYVIPSKTILQGITAAIMFDPETAPEDNFREMKAALKNVKSGEVTFAIRDTSIDGLEIHKDDFIGIFEKHILVNGNDKLKVALELIDNMIDDEASIITILYGQDVDKDTIREFRNALEENYPDIDLEIRDGGQPIYSFLIGVE